MTKKLESVWHYTTAAGLHSIVKNGVLWATSHRFMNDSEEPRYATSVLQTEAKRLRVDLEGRQTERFDQLMEAAERRRMEAFLLCAARASDLLTVWRGYGAEVPYALELDATVSLLPVVQIGQKGHPSPPVNWGAEAIDRGRDGQPIYGDHPDSVRIETQPWAAVDYGTKDVRRRVRNIVTLAKSEPTPIGDLLVPHDNLGSIDLLQLKHPAFEDEREARMVFDVNPRWKFVKHRVGRFGLIPYIEVSTADEKNSVANRPYVTGPGQKLPIRSVHIGPSPLGDETIDALREFLEFSGYPDVEIQKSNIPFRQ